MGGPMWASAPTKKEETDKQTEKGADRVVRPYKWFYGYSSVSIRP